MKHKITLRLMNDIKIEMLLNIDEIESFELRLAQLEQELYKYRQQVTKLEMELSND